MKTEKKTIKNPKPAQIKEMKNNNWEIESFGDDWVKFFRRKAK